MAEDIRAVLSQFHEEHFKQHGLETAAMAEHDLHLERGVVLVAVVGQVSARKQRDIFSGCKRNKLDCQRACARQERLAVFFNLRPFREEFVR